MKYFRATRFLQVGKILTTRPLMSFSSFTLLLYIDRPPKMSCCGCIIIYQVHIINILNARFILISFFNIIIMLFKLDVVYKQQQCPEFVLNSHSELENKKKKPLLKCKQNRFCSQIVCPLVRTCLLRPAFIFILK